MPATDTVSGPPAVSVIIPARNEEVSLASCLESLVAQAGVAFEIIVVNDHSTDRTRAIADSFSNSQTQFPLRVIEAGPLAAGWTGKNNAVAAGARSACGEWLLFTDADTIHLPGSARTQCGRSQTTRRGLALIFAGADRRQLLGKSCNARDLRRAGVKLSPIRSEQS